MSSQVSYDVDPIYSCWLWTGKLSTTNGRPIVWLGRKPVSAYKYIYEQEIGPVPDGLVLDHLCRRPTLCVNPRHLEPVTKNENELRKSWRYRSRTILRCPQGHDLKLSGAVTPEGGKACRLCR